MQGIEPDEHTAGLRRRAARIGALALAALAIAGVAIVLSGVTREPGIEVPAQTPVAISTASGPMTCMPQPSACGFPDRTNTGRHARHGALSGVGAVTLSTPGQVYENKQLTGGIIGHGAERDDPQREADRDRPRLWHQGLRLAERRLRAQARARGDRPQRHYDAKGIAFDGYTASNVFIHNGSDCAHMGSNVTIQDSYCVIGPDTNGDGAIDDSSFCNGPQHFDGLQSDGGRNITIRHNTIRNPCGQTSAILLSTNTERIEGVTIDHNLLSGGGYTVYCGTGEGGVAPNTTYTRNVISKEFFRNGGRYGATTSCEKVTDSTGNISDGEYVPSENPAGTSTPAGRSPSARLSIDAATRSARVALKRQLKTSYTRRAKGATTRCARRADAVAACRVRWTRRQRGRTSDRYTGTVTVTRVSSTRTTCAVRLRRWSRSCGCTTRIPTARSGRSALKGSC